MPWPWPCASGMRRRRVEQRERPAIKNTNLKKRELLVIDKSIGETHIKTKVR